MATIRNVLVRVGVSDRGVTAGVRRLQKSFKGLEKSALKISKISIVGSSAVAGVSALGGAAAVSAQGLLQLGAAIAPVTGLLAALPGAAAGAAGALIVLKLALYGVGDAMKYAYQGKTDEFEKSLKKLTPAARSFAKEFKATVPALKDFQRAAQTGFFSELNGSLARFVGLLKSTQPYIRTLAAELGKWARSVLVFATAEKSVRQFSNILGFTRSSLSSLREALYPLLHGFLDLAEVGARFLSMLAPGVAGAISSFGQWMSTISRTGKAMEWMKTAVGTLAQLGRIAGSVGGILRDVFKAAGQSGGGLLGTIEKVTARMAEFTSSAEGARTLKAIFSSVGQIGSALAPVVVSLARGLGAIAPAIGRIAIAVGPLLTSIVNSLAPALAGLEPGITAIVRSLGGAIASIIPAVGRIAAVIGPILGDAIMALAPAIAALEPGLTALVRGLGGALVAMAPAFQPIAEAISGIAIGLAPILPALGTLIAMLAQGLAAHIQRMLPVLPSLVDAIITLGMALGQGLLDALTAISPYMPQLVLSLSDLLLALIPAIPSIVELVIALTPLVPIVADVIVLLSQLVTAVMPSLTTSMRLFTNVVNVLVGVMKREWAVMYQVVKWAIDQIGRVIATLSTLPTKISDWFGRAASGAASKLNGLLSFIGKIPGWIGNAFRNAGSWLYTSGKNILIGLWNGIASMAGKIASWIGNLVRSIIPGPVRRVLGIASPSKVFRGFGVNLGQGLIQGMASTQSLVARAAQGLADAAMPTLGTFAGPQMAMAGAPSMSTPVGVSRSAGAGAQQGIDYRQLAGALVSAMRSEGVGAVHLDGQKISESVSRRQGRAADQRRRTG